MNDYKCVYAKFVAQGLYQKIICTKLNNICPCSRYCPTKKSVEHSDMAQYCLQNPNRIEYKNKKQ